MKETFISMMMQAKRMELDACKELIPDTVRPHLHNMKNEMYLLAKDCISSARTHTEEPEKAKPVSRVPIE